METVSSADGTAIAFERFGGSADPEGAAQP